jgi:thiamine pyrophosphate-dependent acetolactate synthase large subunit-like protein
MNSTAAVFATTHWSVVLAGGQSDDAQASAALEQLCRTYRYPLYAYLRRRGYSSEDAQDLILVIGAGEESYANVAAEI